MSCKHDIKRAAHSHLHVYEYVLPLALSLPIPSFFYPDNEWLRFLAVAPSLLLMTAHITSILGLATNCSHEISGALSELLAVERVLSRQRLRVLVFYHAGLLPVMYALSQVPFPWFTLIALAVNTLVLFFYKNSWTILLEVTKSGPRNPWL